MDQAFFAVFLNRYFYFDITYVEDIFLKICGDICAFFIIEIIGFIYPMTC